MKKHFKILFSILILFTILLSSCATTLNIQVTRPAKLNLKGAKTIGVLPFDESDKNPFNYFFDGDKDIIENYFNYYGEISRVEQNIISYIHENLERGLMNSPYISLVNYRELKNALKYGSKNPADVFIGGDVVSFKIVDRQSKVKHKIPSDELVDPNKPEYYYEYYYSREVELIFNYDIVDGETRRIIAHDTKKINETSGSYSKMKELPSAFSMISYEIDSFISELMHNIQPYTVTKSITLLEDKTDNQRMKHADELAKDRYYKESYSEYIKIYMHTKQFEAGYNAAMLLMAIGELRSADALMNEVYKNHGDKRALDAIYDIRNEIKQAELLDNQLNPIDNQDYDTFTFDYNEYN